MNRSSDDRKVKKRMFSVLLVVFLLWCTLAARLFVIQVWDSRHFSDESLDLVKRSVAQRKRELVLDTGRGLIVDRHGKAFTGETIFSLVVFPVISRPEEIPEEFRKVAEIVGTPVEVLWNQVREAKVPQIIQHGLSASPLKLTKEEAEKINNLNLMGLRAVPYNRRYGNELLANHVIGYIGKNPHYIAERYTEEVKQGLLTLDSQIGVAGIEKKFQPFLQGLGPTVVSYFVNAKGDPLRGLQIRYEHPENPFYPLSVVTTLDYDVQRSMEKAMDDANIEEGAAVVLDAKTGDILAMVSRPDFNPNQVNPNGSDWSNRAIKQTIPGSIYKTVVAAAALETGKFQSDDTFYCDGELGKYGFSCWKEGGHGEVTFREAFAQSCNIAFAKMAMELSGDEIEQYSKKLGFLQHVGWHSDDFFHWDHFHQIDGEQEGRLFSEPEHTSDEGVKVQSSIGQRDVRVTPLQAANMVVTLLNRGEIKSPRLVQRIDYLNGTPFYHFPLKELTAADQLEPYTGYEIAKWMRDVVQEGTGKALQQAIWPLAGKSGTAQVFVGNRKLNNQWFVGYGPSDYPRYAIAVVAQNVEVYEEKKAVQAFGSIMDQLAVMESQQN
jgi:cell division protein FtsI/penicillin-binding protein 2